MFEEVILLALNFTSFLVFLVLGTVVALVYHYFLRYRFLDGIASLFGKIIMSWLGGWLGSPVFGHWSWRLEDVYLVPAILGAATALHLSVLWSNAVAKALEGRSIGSEDRHISALGKVA